MRERARLVRPEDDLAKAEDKGKKSLVLDELFQPTVTACGTGRTAKNGHEVEDPLKVNIFPYCLNVWTGR